MSRDKIPFLRLVGTTMVRWTQLLSRMASLNMLAAVSSKALADSAVRDGLQAQIDALGNLATRLVGKITPEDEEEKVYTVYKVRGDRFTTKKPPIKEYTLSDGGKTTSLKIRQSDAQRVLAKKRLRESDGKFAAKEKYVPYSNLKPAATEATQAATDEA